MKDIVILAHFCRDFTNTDNGRFMYLCKELSKHNKVEIITSDFSHSNKKHKEAVSAQWPFKITYLHEPGYKRNISIRRFLSHKSWGAEVKKYLSNRATPDVLYSAIPSLTGPFVAAKYCKREGVRFIVDVQDLWPEAFQLVFNVPVLREVVFWPFRRLANGTYRRADDICAVSKTYLNRAVSFNKKSINGHVVFLGTDLKLFDKYASEHIIEKPSNELWIGYCGTLGASYDLTIIIDALALLKSNGEEIPKLIVLGDGERMAEFEQRAREVQIETQFTGRLPYDEMCGWLKACDIAVNPIRHNAAQSIINKHGDYAAAGIPIINTQENREYRDLVDEYQMGFNCDNSNTVEVADRILQLVKDSKLRQRMGQGSRRCAEERFDRERTYKELCELMLDGVEEGELKESEG